jgi:hypothetical protein
MRVGASAYHAAKAVRGTHKPGPDSVFLKEFMRDSAIRIPVQAAAGAGWD